MNDSVGQSTVESDFEGIDFIDFGASSGGSLRWAQDTFKKVGLGVDLDPVKVQKTKAGGYRAMQADATSLPLPDGAVSFAVVSDFLEHLGTPENARKVIDSAVRVARDFVYLAYPDFDNEQLLNEQGFKRYYADWSGHTLHYPSRAFTAEIGKFGFKHRVLKLVEVFDSFDRSILPLSAPRNSSFYDPTIHDPKPFVVFPRKVFFNRILCVLVKSDRYNLDELLLKVLYSIGYARNVA